MTASAKGCVTGKKRYRYAERAVEALHSTGNNRQAALQCGQATKRSECRRYLCDHCSGWHLTSQPR